MLKGFKDFLMRGNVVDLAVAVVMGTAFTAIVSSVTKGVLEPLLAVLGGSGQLGFGVTLIAGKPATFIALGPIISAVINFVMVAAVLYFALILPMKTVQKRYLARKGAGTEKPVPTDIELLIEIRDLLAERAVGDRNGARDNGSAQKDSERVSSPSA
ncbi:large conductance mechanosensitive channel protein MscL [Nocardia sp. CA-290969]|uniref:large conductance mechanosensitive channel protein MscL n=1 Tax=Nocardia sp. CA-290969 TaxID=3239986 RepID=UPI003D8CAE5C